MSRPKKELDFVICERIKKAREGIGAKQKDMANFLGIPLQTYKNWEQKRNIPNRTKLLEIAGVCHVDIKWLMNIEDEEVEKHIQHEITSDGKIIVQKLSDYTTQELLAEIERRCGE